MGSCFGRGMDPDDQELLDSKRTAEENKLLVRRFFDEVLIAKNLAPLEQYISKNSNPPYIQHNPNIGDGYDATYSAYETWFTQPYQLELLRIGADNDLVFIHSKYELGEKVYAIVDIFRVTNGKISEHWDVVQQVPADASNPHAMF